MRVVVHHVDTPLEKPRSAPPSLLRRTHALSLNTVELIPTLGALSPRGGPIQDPVLTPHPGGNPGGNLKSISQKCYLREVAFEWELTKETIHLPLGCLQGGVSSKRSGATRSATISHTKCFLKSFCRSQLPCKSVSLFFISVNVKNTLTDLWGS